MLWPKWGCMILIALANAALVSPETARDLRCVAILAVAADRSLAKESAFYTAIVGAEAMDETGKTREAVRELIIAQVKFVRGHRPARVEVDACVTSMKSRVAIEHATSG